MLFIMKKTIHLRKGLGLLVAMGFMTPMSQAAFVRIDSVAPGLEHPAADNFADGDHLTSRLYDSATSTAYLAPRLGSNSNAGMFEGADEARPVGVAPYINYSLGDSFDLSQIHIWQYNRSSNVGRRTQDFRIYGSSDGGNNYGLIAEFSSTVNQSYQPYVDFKADVSVAGGMPVRTLDLASVNYNAGNALNVDHIRIEFLANANGSLVGTDNGRVGLSELAFEGVAVPEPSGVALLGLGLIGGVLRRRR